ncbi:hypothetical protein GGR57DRAFT_517630 [Xylariaceae sp. FL1272]|nr:hypothetical protein GGR57DRAFT_517630 [Xylariaceae sp. FL1272]
MYVVGTVSSAVITHLGITTRDILVSLILGLITATPMFLLLMAVLLYSWVFVSPASQEAHEPEVLDLLSLSSTSCESLHGEETVTEEESKSSTQRSGYEGDDEKSASSARSLGSTGMGSQGEAEEFNLPMTKVFEQTLEQPSVVNGVPYRDPGDSWLSGGSSEDDAVL